MMAATRMARMMAVAGCVVAVLTGCSQSPGAAHAPTPKNMTVPAVPPVPAVPVAGVASDRLDDTARLERCRRELDALKKINTGVYEKRLKEFDRLMSGAGIYTGVRGDVSTYTQGAVDAFYRFKADKLCADISNDVLNELARQ